MNWTVVEGEWAELTGELKARWARLTDHDVELLDAKRERLVGKIVQRYGVLKDEAEKQVDEWIQKMGGHRAHPEELPSQRP